MRDSTPGVEVAAGLIIRDGQILIARRSTSAHLGGFWEFPGGKRKPGESFEACLAREVMEELGVTIAVHEQVASAEHRDDERCVHLRFYRCTLLTGEPRPIGCDVCRWVTPSEIDAYPFPPADESLVRQITLGLISPSMTSSNSGSLEPGASLEGAS